MASVTPCARGGVEDPAVGDPTRTALARRPRGRRHGSKFAARRQATVVPWSRVGEILVNCGYRAPTPDGVASFFPGGRIFPPFHRKKKAKVAQPRDRARTRGSG